MTREELGIRLKQAEALPDKDDFNAYLKAGGLYENAYPIYCFQVMTSTDTLGQLEELYEAVRSVFAPTSRYTFQRISGDFWEDAAIDAWLKEDYFGRKYLPRVFTEYTQWLMGQGYDLSLAELDQFLADPLRKSSFGGYCEMRRELMQAQFTFRDSFSGPVAWAYDPDHLLSDADTDAI